MKILYPFLSIFVLIIVVFIGVHQADLHFLFGIIIPYVSILVFLIGMVLRVGYWASSPVPFRIPTTAGQGKTLPWIKQDKLESPSTLPQVLGRMALEILLFRSLFRNTKAELSESKLAYGSNKWLWLGGLAFHWTMLIIIVRHYRLFLEPVPGMIHLIESLDGFFEITLPTFYVTDALILICVSFLLLRRLLVPQIRYISLAADYFPLFLIFSIVISGILMRYVLKTDVVKIKMLIGGLLSFQFQVPEGIGTMFYVHLFLVCVLGIYFPFSKLVHMGGVFLSPTRNLANNNREKRHINPWNPKVKIRSYPEYESEFREKMIDAEIPLEEEKNE
ncbi:MAG: sulfate reduction electron transfer complex DsrMKJOP subunit DsrM [SAR324 cluster bacterium]|nr:sulfate reduction electron transfer complex DsrMKJOP subunit DsrM [SAR324 cluster bacterium]